MKYHIFSSVKQSLCGRQTDNLLSDLDLYSDTLDMKKICLHCAKLDNYIQTKYIFEDGQYRLRTEDEIDYIIFQGVKIDEC